MAPLTPQQRMIREVIEELGFTHQQAARVFGVSYAALHSWIVGTRSPSKRSLDRMAEGLDAHSAEAAKLADRVRRES